MNMTCHIKISTSSSVHANCHATNTLTTNILRLLQRQSSPPFFVFNSPFSLLFLHIFSHSTFRHTRLIFSSHPHVLTGCTSRIFSCVLPILNIGGLLMC